MIRRDYILRMIEQFFQVVRQIVNHRKQERHADALELVRQGYRSFLGADARFIDRHAAQDLIEMMGSGLLGAEQLVMAAKLLKEEGDLLADLELREDAGGRRKKALALFLEVYLGPGCERLGGLFDDVEPLVESLQEDGIAAGLARRLALFHERRGRFAKAEDALFSYLEALPDDREALAEGVALFERLTAIDDAALEEGGLTRGEVEEALDELRKR